MARGAVWMVLFKLIERSLGLVSTLILARLLVPADFGLVAMALSFIFMAELLTAFGFDVALIQNQNASLEHYNTAWTGNFLLGISVTLLMVALAVPIAHFYRKPELVWIVCALAAGPAVSGLENIGIVAFRKDLNFRREFSFQISRKVVGFLVVVPLAFLLRSYWALVAGILASKLTGTVLSYLLHPFRPRFTLSKFRELFRFSRWLLFNNGVAYFKERSSDFFIGRFYGAAPLGVYNISYELANLPSSELSAPINRALLPGFAKMTSSDEIASAYGNAVGLMALITLPASAGLLAVAPYLVFVVLGAKWLEAIPLMEVLAFNGALLMFHSSICSVLIARGHPAQVTQANGIYVLFLLTLLALLSWRFGVTGAAYAALLSSVLATPVYLWHLQRRLGIPATVFFRAVMRPLVAATLMAVVVRASSPEFSPGMPMASATAWLVIGVVIGVVTYLIVTATMWLAAGRPPGPELLVLERVMPLIRGRHPAASSSTDKS